MTVAEVGLRRRPDRDRGAGDHAGDIPGRRQAFVRSAAPPVIAMNYGSGRLEKAMTQVRF